MERIVGDVTREQLDQIAERSQEIRAARYPQITWEHTHVLRTPEGLKAVCLYASPDADSVKQHAAELGLPLEGFYEVETDLSP
jgi:Nickel responsive protein SCO4226-like